MRKGDHIVVIGRSPLVNSTLRVALPLMVSR